MTGLSAARRLARFALALRADDLPGPVIAQAQLLALDTLGSCLASSTMDFGSAVLDTAGALGGRAESTLVGRSGRIAAANAVLANATLAHGLDFDDTREDAIVHTGCVAVTAAFAAGEAAGVTGARVVEAIVTGVEAMCRIGLVVPGRFHARHFHPTSLTASFAAAVVGGKLAGLGEDQLVHALGICGSQAGGIIEYLGDGSWTKRLHPGWAAHAGIVATQLAAAGFTGPERVFEGEHGFYAAFAGGHDPARLEAELASLGRTWEILNLTYKPYPAGSIAHPYMDCAARLREKHAIAPESIAEVRCRTAEGPLPRLWEPLAAKHRPHNGYAAKFSLPYLLASVLVRGTAGLADFTDDAARDERVLAVAGRVGYEIDPTIDYPRQFVGHVRIRLHDGRVLEERQDHPRGGPDFPLPARDLEAKFRGNATLALSAETVERIVEDAARLATLPTVGPFMARLNGRNVS